MSQPCLRVRDLKKTYRRGFAGKKVEAVKGISFDIQPATITGFLGANGAGKTTTIKCLLNLAFADSGEVHYFGQSSLTSEAKQKIGFLPERPYFYEYLTGAEFLRFYGELSTSLKAADLKDRIERLLKRVGLTHAKDRQLRSYSKGMLQRVGIAQALVHEPEFIILDEPMTGLDPDGRYEVTEIIRETAKAGTAVFFSSHQLPDAERICDRLVILKLGHLIYEGTTNGFLDQTESGVLISYRPAGGHKIESSVAKDSHGAQNLIDALRRQEAEILEVKTQRMS
ncbi:MAG: ABC transporter ATP-binding protein, partial [Bdellovibrionaceae bacterium]|nr:ABC transporter ATP-binding protein [Pseudobdellovibrionaceae bacterium]